MKVFGRLNNALIANEDVSGVVNEIKAGKAAGLNGCAVESLKIGGISVIEWLVGFLDVCFVTSIVPLNWTSASVVTL